MWVCFRDTHTLSRVFGLSTLEDPQRDDPWGSCFFASEFLFIYCKRLKINDSLFGCYQLLLLFQYNVNALITLAQLLFILKESLVFAQHNEHYY